MEDDTDYKSLTQFRSQMFSAKKLEAGALFQRHSMPQEAHAIPLFTFPNA